MVRRWQDNSKIADFAAWLVGFSDTIKGNRLTCELSHVWLFARLKSRLPRLVFGRGICVANVVWELAEGSAETRHFSLFLRRHC